MIDPENRMATYMGWLSKDDYGDSLDLLFLSSISDPFIKELQWMVGKRVAVRYWIANQECTKEQAEDCFTRKTMGITGNVSGGFEVHYSDITGYLWTDENLQVGGHDLVRELGSYEGKWLILEIESPD